MNKKLQDLEIDMADEVSDKENQEDMDEHEEADDSIVVVKSRNSMEELKSELKFHNHRTYQLLRQNYEVDTG